MPCLSLSPLILGPVTQSWSFLNRNEVGSHTPPTTPTFLCKDHHAEMLLLVPLWEDAGPWEHFSCDPAHSWDFTCFA